MAAGGLRAARLIGQPVATDPQPAISEERSGQAPPVLDLIAAAFLVALSILVMIGAARMEVPDALATAPGLLPFLTAASLCVMALALGWQALRRRPGAAARGRRRRIPPSCDAP